MPDKEQLRIFSENLSRLVERSGKSQKDIAADIGVSPQTFNTKMAYRDYIEALRSEFVGKRVMYEGKVYTIAMVDYNGIIHIDKPSQYNETTAVYEAYEARKALI